MTERPARRRKSSKSVEQLKAEISARDEEKASKAVSRKPSGAAAEAQEAARKRKNAAKYEQEKAERAKKGSSGYGYSQHLMGGSSSSSGFNPRSVREEILVDYLLGEGFASDEKSAQAIAGAMSEDWVQSIVEGLTPLGIKTAGVVDDQRRGSTRDKDLKDTRDSLNKMKAYPNGFPGVKGV